MRIPVTVKFGDSEQTLNIEAINVPNSDGQSYLMGSNAVITEKFTVLLYDYTSKEPLGNPKTVEYGDNIKFTMSCPPDADTTHQLQLLFYTGEAGKTAYINSTFTNLKIEDITDEENPPVKIYPMSEGDSGLTVIANDNTAIGNIDYQWRRVPVLDYSYGIYPAHTYEITMDKASYEVVNDSVTTYMQYKITDCSKPFIQNINPSNIKYIGECVVNFTVFQYYENIDEPFIHQSTMDETIPVYKYHLSQSHEYDFADATALVDLELLFDNKNYSTTSVGLGNNLQKIKIESNLTYTSMDEYNNIKLNDITGSASGTSVFFQNYTFSSITREDLSLLSDNFNNWCFLCGLRFAQDIGPESIMPYKYFLIKLYDDNTLGKTINERNILSEIFWPGTDIVTYAITWGDTKRTFFNINFIDSCTKEIKDNEQFMINANEEILGNYSLTYDVGAPPGYSIYLKSGLGSVWDDRLTICSCMGDIVEINKKKIPTNTISSSIEAQKYQSSGTSYHFKDENSRYEYWFLGDDYPLETFNSENGEGTGSMTARISQLGDGKANFFKTSTPSIINISGSDGYQIKLSDNVFSNFTGKYYVGSNVINSSGTDITTTGGSRLTTQFGNSATPYETEEELYLSNTTEPIDGNGQIDVYPFNPGITPKSYEMNMYRTKNVYENNSNILIDATGDNKREYAYYNIYNRCEAGHIYDVNIKSATLNESDRENKPKEFACLLYEAVNGSASGNVLKTVKIPFGNNIHFKMSIDDGYTPTHNVWLLLYAGINGETSGNKVTFSNVAVNEVVEGIDGLYTIADYYSYDKYQIGKDSYGREG